MFGRRNRVEFLWVVGEPLCCRMVEITTSSSFFIYPQSVCYAQNSKVTMFSDVSLCDKAKGYFPCLCHLTCEPGEGRGWDVQ